MEVFIPKSSGFCPGVQRAEDQVFQLKEKSDYVYTHGPLIHNKNYISYLNENHISSVEIGDLNEGETLVIRTHGIDRNEEQELATKYQLKDLTCPIVKRVQKHIDNASKEKAFVVISGKENHAEVKGLVSYADHVFVIETMEDKEHFLNHYQEIIPQDCSYLYLLSQTTHSRSFFEHLIDELQKNISYIPVVVKDTICPVTENKEKESLQIQEDVDFTVVVGDTTSSNSKKLFKVLSEHTDNVVFVQNLTNLKEIKNDWTGISKVLLVSSTSTPRFIENEIANYLREL